METPKKEIVDRLVVEMEESVLRLRKQEEELKVIFTRIDKNLDLLLKGIQELPNETKK